LRDWKARFAVRSEELSRLADEAGFVFKGRVVPRHGAEIEAGGETELETVTVEVEEVLSGTEVTRGLVGADVTVVREQGAPTAEGDSRVFFTTVLSLGDEVVVREIAQREAADASMSEIAEGIRIADERPLVERLAGADLIVTGRVASEKPVGRELVPASEHDPLWSIARVAIDTVLKDRSSRKTVDVLFASSRDIAWYDSPKLHEGLSGIFVLRKRDEAEAPDEVAPGVYQATHPLDFLPHDRLDDVRRLIGDNAGAA
jgi:hypothetical protein